MSTPDYDNILKQTDGAAGTKFDAADMNPRWLNLDERLEDLETFAAATEQGAEINPTADETMALVNAATTQIDDARIPSSITRDTEVATAIAHVSETSNPHSVTKDQVLSGDKIVDGDIDASADIDPTKLDHSQADVYEMTEINGLSTALAGKSDTTHTHKHEDLEELDDDDHINYLWTKAGIRPGGAEYDGMFRDLDMHNNDIINVGNIKFDDGTIFNPSGMVITLPDNMITVGKNGTGDFDNIADAITEVITKSPSATNPWAIALFPGRYTITAGFTLPDYVSLFGFGSKAAEIYSTDTIDFITVGEGSVLQNFTMKSNGAATSGTYFIRANGKDFVVDNVICEAAGTSNNRRGILLEGGSELELFSSRFEVYHWGLHVKDTATAQAEFCSWLSQDAGAAIGHEGSGEVKLYNSSVRAGNKIIYHMGTGDLKISNIKLINTSSSAAQCFFYLGNSSAYIQACDVSCEMEGVALDYIVDGTAGQFCGVAVNYNIPNTEFANSAVTVASVSGRTCFNSLKINNFVGFKDLDTRIGEQTGTGWLVASEDGGSNYYPIFKNLGTKRVDETSLSNNYIPYYDSSSGTFKFKEGSGKTFSLTAGEALDGTTNPVAVYQKSSDGKVYKTDANTSGETVDNFVGFVVDSVSSGNDADIHTGYYLDGFSGLTVGDTIYLSDTDGAISQTAGTNEKAIGVAISTTEIMFFPVYIPVTGSGGTTTTTKTLTYSDLSELSTNIKLFDTQGSAVIGVGVNVTTGFNAGFDFLIAVDNNSYEMFDGTVSASTTGKITNDNGYLNQVWFNYNGTEELRLIPDSTTLGWSTVGNMSTARRAAGSGGTKTSFWIAGGYNGSTLSSTEEYTSSWAAGGTLNYARSFGGGCGNITAGMITGANTAADDNRTEEYDGTSWTNSGATTNGHQRVNNGVCGTQTAALVVSGYGTATCEEYDGSTWSSGGSIAAERNEHAVFGTQTAATEVAGYDSGFSRTTSVSEYDGSTWSSGTAISTATAGMAGLGTYHAGTIIGGNTSSGNLSSTQEYDGSSWSSSYTMNTAADRLSGAGSSTSAIKAAGDNGGSYLQVTETLSGGLPTLTAGEMDVVIKYM